MREKTITVFSQETGITHGITALPWGVKFIEGERRETRRCAYCRTKQRDAVRCESCGAPQ